jgi:hypothetical protein
MGMAQSTGMGIGPLAWSEIAAFAQSTCAISDPWELRAIRQMSEQYVAGLRQGEQPLVIPPAERTYSGSK